ncbi:MAG: hypothetical protein U0263_01705 [Polyangiaceae bacterium]
MRRWLALLLALVGCSFAERATAAQLCDPSVGSWLAACSKSEGRAFELVTCDRGVIVVRAADASLDVEISRASARSFRRAGDIGLAPVGQFADWASEPAPRRAALDALERCANGDASLVFSQAAGDEAVLRPSRPPWFFALGVLLLGLVASRAKLRPTREHWLLAALGLLTGVLRFAWLGGSFFHQNGQGPAWVGYALRADVGLSAYGSGYPELFGAAARLAGDDPERGVWIAQSLLGAALPPAAFAIARGLGARRVAATVVALILALDPLLARLATSESYFGAIVALSMLATGATLAAGHRPRSARFWLALAAAGAFGAALVRLHPVAWPALVSIPLPLLFAPGSARRRVRSFALGSFVVFAFVLLAAGSEMQAVARGSLGAKWLPHAGPRWEFLAVFPYPLLMGSAIAAGLALRSWRGVGVAFFAPALVAIARLTDLTSAPNDAIVAAHQALFLPGAVVLASVVMARWSRRRLVELIPPGAALVAALSVLPQRARCLVLPTDALEGELVRSARRSIEREAHVAFLERAGTQVAVLPLYSGLSARPAPLREGDRHFDLKSLPGPTYYYRSSLCSTADGAEVCAEIERRTPLVLRWERTLPARSSMRWNGYLGGEVRVALYEVKR